MTKQNKTLTLIIVLSTVLIASTLSIIVYFVFGQKAAYFFVTVFAIPIGIVGSLLLLMLRNAMNPDKIKND